MSSLSKRTDENHGFRVPDISVRNNITMAAGRARMETPRDINGQSSRVPENIHELVYQISSCYSQRYRSTEQVCFSFECPFETSAFLTLYSTARTLSWRLLFCTQENKNPFPRSINWTLFPRLIVSIRRPSINGSIYAACQISGRDLATTSFTRTRTCHYTPGMNNPFYLSEHL